MKHLLAQWQIVFLRFIMPRYEKLNAPVPITYVSLLPLLTKLRERFLGKSLDPLNPATRHRDLYLD